MPKLVIWRTPEEASRELYTRLSQAKTDRSEIERRWELQERTIFATRSQDTGRVGTTLGDVEGGGSQTDIGTNYALKNTRLIHAQLSSNPPSVAPKPASNDQEDRRAADAADRLIQYGRKQYKIAEHVDLASWDMLIRGSGFIKTQWDPEGGDMLSYDEQTGHMKMEGDFHISVPSPWDIFPDPEATGWDQVRYVFERIYMPLETALFLFPDKEELLKASATVFDGPSATNSAAHLRDIKFASVELYQYWEKGLPQNAFLGRFCVCTKDGQLLTPVTENPERYSPGTAGSKRPARAVLPYHLFTDLDVPQQVWGKSMVEYQIYIQDNLNRLDSIMLESAQAHGVPRIILPEGSEIADDSITNSPWDIIKTTGSVPPHFMEPMPLPAAAAQLREMMRMGLDDMAGVNESMFGQQSREQSGFSMQYATNQGNTIRRRLFNKYVIFVEDIYRRYLQILQKNWIAPRTVAVLGKEKSFELKDLQGADIAGGYDLVVEYGTTLSLDPITRREEIMTMMPLFKEAGVDPRELLRMVRLNELGNMYDDLELARDRQQEIFEQMIQTQAYVEPEQLEDHPNMLVYCKRYRMTKEFKNLDMESKLLIEKHIKDREKMLASTVAQAQGAGPAPAPEGLGMDLLESIPITQV